MRHIRSLVQTWIIIVFGSCIAILVARFIIDFLVIRYEGSLIEPLYNFSDALTGPFKDTYERSEADDCVLDFSTVVGIVAFGFTWVICHFSTKVFFKGDLKMKLKRLITLAFGAMEGLLLFRLILVLTNANSSKFLDFLEGITSILIIPTLSLIGDADSSLIGAILIAMGVLALLWFTFYKLVLSAIESVESVESKQLARRKIEERQRPLVTSTSLEAASTMYSEEVVGPAELPQEKGEGGYGTSDKFLMNDPSFVSLDAQKSGVKEVATPSAEAPTTKASSTVGVSPEQGTRPSTLEQEEEASPKQQKKSLGTAIKGAAKELLGSREESPTPFEQEEDKEKSKEMPKSPLG